MRTRHEQELLKYEYRTAFFDIFKGRAADSDQRG